MACLDESNAEMRNRLDRELAAYRRKLRLEYGSLLALWIYFLIYASILPFTTSIDQIIFLFSIFLIFAGQFIYVMRMD